MDLKREPKIFLEKADKFDLCNGCCSSEDLKVLYIGHDSISISMVLCDKCRDELINVLMEEQYQREIEYTEENKHYEMKFSKDKKKCIVYSKNAMITPLDEIKLIKEEIQKSHVENDVTIYFDFLMCSGNGLNRFAKARYDKQQENILDFEEMKISKDYVLRKISANYYKDKHDIIDNSILTSVQKKMIKKGLAI